MTPQTIAIYHSVRNTQLWLPARLLLWH